MSEWTEETIKPHFFTEVEVRDGEKKYWMRANLCGYRHEDIYPFVTSANCFRYMRLIPKKKTVPYDAISCPRHPVLKNIEDKEGVEFYPNVYENGLAAFTCVTSGGCLITWEELAADNSPWRMEDGSRWVREVEDES